MSLLTISLDKLCDTGLFHHAGHVCPEYARGPKTWDEAIALIQRDEDDLTPVDNWSTFQIQRANDLGTSVRLVSTERHHQWNDHARRAKARLAECLPTILERTTVPEETLGRVLPDVKWTLVHAFIEEAFSDISAVNFYQQMCQILVEGHFPCGWDGEYPAGRPIVY